MSYTASGRTVFKLGSEEKGNREVVIVEDGSSYELDYEAQTTYADELTTFPYQVEA